jgi:flagellar motor switch protein FliG
MSCDVCHQHGVDELYGRDIFHVIYDQIVAFAVSLKNAASISRSTIDQFMFRVKGTNNMSKPASIKLMENLRMAGNRLSVPMNAKIFTFSYLQRV